MTERKQAEKIAAASKDLLDLLEARAPVYVKRYGLHVRWDMKMANAATALRAALDLPTPPEDG